LQDLYTIPMPEIRRTLGVSTRSTNVWLTAHADGPLGRVQRRQCHYFRLTDMVTRLRRPGARFRSLTLENGLDDIVALDAAALPVVNADVPLGTEALERAISFCSVLNRDEIDRLTLVRSKLTSALVYALWHRAVFTDLELLRDLIVLHPMIARFILSGDPVFLPATEQEWGMFAAAFAVANV
jgi:hypothetical protein